MSYRMTTADVRVTFDVDKVERKLAAFCKSNNITTDAQMDAFIDGLGSAGLATATKELLKGLIKITPPAP